MANYDPNDPRRTDATDPHRPVDPSGRSTVVTETYVEPVEKKASPLPLIIGILLALARILAEDARTARLFEEAPRVAVLEQHRHNAFRVFSELLAAGIYADRGAGRAEVTSWFVVAGTVEVLTRWLGGAVPMDEAEVVATIADIGVRLSGPDPS